MDFKNLILKRQSDRKYLDKKVERDKIDVCINSARLSPSACNSQPWTFVVVDNDEKVKQMAKATSGMGMNNFTKHCLCFVAIVMEKPNLTAKIGCFIKDKNFPLIDIGIASSFFCLQATELGLGSCILGWFDEKKVKQILNIPDKKRVPIVICVGYADTRTREKIRKDFNIICKDNTY